MAAYWPLYRVQRNVADRRRPNRTQARTFVGLCNATVKSQSMYKTCLQPKMFVDLLRIAIKRDMVRETTTASAYLSKL